jgi:hypothetical protein
MGRSRGKRAAVNSKQPSVSRWHAVPRHWVGAEAVPGTRFAGEVRGRPLGRPCPRTPRSPWARGRQGRHVCYPSPVPRADGLHQTCSHPGPALRRDTTPTPCTPPIMMRDSDSKRHLQLHAACKVRLDSERSGADEPASSASRLSSNSTKAKVEPPTGGMGTSQRRSSCWSQVSVVVETIG